MPERNFFRDEVWKWGRGLIPYLRPDGFLCMLSSRKPGLILALILESQIVSWNLSEMHLMHLTFSLLRKNARQNTIPLSFNLVLKNVISISICVEYQVTQAISLQILTQMMCQFKSCILNLIFKEIYIFYCVCCII